MQKQLQKEHRIGTAMTLFYFVIGFLIASLLVSCAPKPQAKAFELGVKPKVNRVYPATFYSDKR